MMYGYGNGTGGWGCVLMAIGMILFWGGDRRHRGAGPIHPDQSGCSPSGSPAARSTTTNTTSASPACGQQGPAAAR